MKIARTAVVALFVAACGGGEPAEESAPESAPPPAPSVTITMPTEGQTITGTRVIVQLSSTVPIVPAGDMTPGTGHHHLYVNTDLGDMSAPIPGTVPNQIIHMGDASREYYLEGLPSGNYRIIAVVADGAHIPLQPLVADTVNITVQLP